MGLKAAGEKAVFWAASAVAEEAIEAREASKEAALLGARGEGEGGGTTDPSHTCALRCSRHSQRNGHYTPGPSSHGSMRQTLHRIQGRGQLAGRTR